MPENDLRSQPSRYSLTESKKDSSMYFGNHVRDCMRMGALIFTMKEAKLYALIKQYFICIPSQFNGFNT